MRVESHNRRTYSYQYNEEISDLFTKLSDCSLNKIS